VRISRLLQFASRPIDYLQQGGEEGNELGVCARILSDIMAMKVHLPCPQTLANPSVKSQTGEITRLHLLTPPFAPILLCV
jgi:hypothetical protein